MTRRGVLGLGLVFAAAAIVEVFASSVGARASAAYTSGGWRDYLTALQWGALPLAVLATLVFWLGPGLMLTACYAKMRSVTAWLVWGFAISLVVEIAMAPATLLVAGAPVSRSAYLSGHLLVGSMAWVLLWSRAGRLDAWPSPFAGVAEKRRAMVIGLMAMVGLLVLLPFLFWQDLNTDGIEAMAIGQSLSRSLLPRTLTTSGVMSIGSGLVSQAYLSHAFLMLVGPMEGALRLPLLLFLPLLFAALVELAEWRSRRALRLPEELLVAVALASYTAVMAFNASYDPYFADIAAPTVEDTMLVVCILGAMLAMVEERPFFLIVYGVLASFARPTGFLFLLAAIPASFLASERMSRTWRRQIGVALVMCVAAIVAYEALSARLVAVGTTVAGSGVFGRFRYLTFFDWRRSAYLVVPSGILPSVALLYYKRQDGLSRLVTILTIGFFLLFYVTAFVALHHFVFAMILPLVVFWRLYLASSERWQRVVLRAAWIAAVLSIWLALPRHFDVNRTARDIGRRTVIRTAGPDEPLRDMLARIEVLSAVARYDWWVANPGTELVSSPATVAFYADRANTTVSGHDYVVTAATEPGPSGMPKVGEDQGTRLFVRDRARLAADRFRTQRTDYRSPLYDIPRDTLFRHWGEPARHYDLDLAALLRLR